MPRTLDTLGNSIISIAICDRCRMKRAYVDLSQDPNFPGLRVCNEGCKDEFDPYRLPARQPEKISIRLDRKSTRLNSSHSQQSRMPSSA